MNIFIVLDKTVYDISRQNSLRKLNVTGERSFFQAI